MRRGEEDMVKQLFLECEAIYAKACRANHRKIRAVRVCA